MDDKLTTVSACKIVGLDRQRFNEFVASGDYPCAPETLPGRSRLFDEIDLIALFVFARLTDTKHVRPIIAGIHACNVRDVLRRTPAADLVEIRADLLSPQIQTAHATSFAEGLQSIGDEDVLSVTHYNIARIRNFIRGRLETAQKLAALAKDLDKETGEMVG